MHREKIDPEVGSAQIEPGDSVKVNSIGTWRITYTAGQKGIEIGGKVRITIPHGFSLPQTKAFFDKGFATV